MEEQKKMPVSPHLQNREKSVLPNSSPELTADVDTSSPLEDLKLMIDRTFGGTDSPTGESSIPGSVRSLEMDESSSSLEQSRNMAFVTSIMEKLPIEEKLNFILAALKNFPMNQQVEMLSVMAKNKDVDRQTLPLFAGRAIHSESAAMEKEPGSQSTSNTGVQDVEVSAQPLERLFGISEVSVYKDAKETVVGILEQPPALDQPETEQRARALVHAVHQPINNAMSNYISKQKAGEPMDEEVIKSGNLVVISGRVAAAIMAGLAVCSCSKPFQNLYSSMAATMQKLSVRLKSQAEYKEDPEDVLPTSATLPPLVVPAKSVSLNGSFKYSLEENATFSKEDLTKVTRAASEILVNASRCISTELLPTPDDVDAEVVQIVQTVASDMQRLYVSIEESSSLKELVTTTTSDGAEKFSMASRVALNSALGDIYKNVHGKIKSLFTKSATLETGESDTTPAQKESSETRSVSSFPISSEAFQATSSLPIESCSSSRVPVDLEVDEPTENAVEAKKLKDAEAELSGLMELMLFIGEDPASVETKLDILLCSGALRPLTDELAKQLQAFMQANSHVRAPAVRRCVSDMTVPGAKTTGENQREALTQEGFKDLVYIFTESKIRALLENLVGLLFPTPDAVEIVQCSHSAGRLPMGQGGCRNRLTCIFQEITGLFTRKTADKVSDTMFRTICCLLRNRVEQVSSPAPSHSGRELRSVVNLLVAQNMTKIGGTVDNQEVSRRVSKQILSLVCAASGLKEDQVYPEDIDVENIYKTVKKTLRAQFESKEGLRTAAAKNDPIFERSLVCFLSYALVKPIKEREAYVKKTKKPSLLKRLFQKKAKPEEPCQTFSNQDNTTPAEKCTIPSVAASPEKPPATEQKPKKKSVWIRFYSSIVKTFT